MEIPTLTLLLITAMSGIYTCRMIILHLLDRDSPLGSKLCVTTGRFNCNSVLRSPLGKVSGNIHLGDIGLVYFIAQTIFIILESISGRTRECIDLLAFPSLLAFAFSLFSLGYQAFLIKAWCKMCLIISGLIWLQALVMIGSYAFRQDNQTGYFPESSVHLQQLPSLLTGLFSLLMASGWFFVRNNIVQAGEAEATSKKLLQFKKNPAVFRATIKSQRTIDPQRREDDFLLGARNAPVQLLVALNLYCAPCAREYQEILHLLRLFPDSLEVIIRFYIPAESDKSARAAAGLLMEYRSTLPTARPQILEKWFASFMQKGLTSMKDPGGMPPGIDKDVLQLLQRHRNWFEENRIAQTPDIYVNGFALPKLYILADLRVLMPSLSRKPLKFATSAIPSPAANNSVREP